MAEENQKNKILLSVLIVVVGFVSGLFTLAVITIILSALGLLSVF